MSVSVSRVKWEQAAPLLKAIREKVFICEWRIPKRVEFDRNDRSAYHMLVCDDTTQEPIATGRLLPTGEISRVAVLMGYRKQNVDQVVLEGLIKIAKELEMDEVFINSPLNSVEYFLRHNFIIKGSVFMEAGRAKQRMACSLNKFKMAKKYYLSH